MVLRDSFLASEKVKIVMLTCICPGMSSANHTMNSLRYAERLKEKGQGGQGAPGSKGYKADPAKIREELRLFMEKHAQSSRANSRQLGNLNNVFYQDERLDDEEMLFDEPEEQIIPQPKRNKEPRQTVQMQSAPLLPGKASPSMPKSTNKDKSKQTIPKKPVSTGLQQSSLPKQQPRPSQEAQIEQVP